MSGGGFRAAFFHIGVLARLAELGILRNVEVISTVSGGSIVGSLYYLRLKWMLEHEADATAGSVDHAALDARYCAIVADVEERLRSAVRKNPRARVTSNLVKNLMMMSPKYSRSDRMGDLYDRYLYKSAWGRLREPKWGDWGPQKQIALRELLIRPRDSTGRIIEDFRPFDHNGTRVKKVPILVINATSLNTGHNWRFEAVRMGEADDPSDRAADRNMVLGEAYFAPDYPKRDGTRVWPVPEKKRDFPFAKAVAASAAVPGIFNPLPINDLYPEIRVELSDGGVQDNQGLRALRDLKCTHMIISDASGQMGDILKPAETAPAVAGRAGSIARDRIRDEQLRSLFGDANVAVMDLRKGTSAPVVPPVGSKTEVAEPGDDESLSWGVSRRVQKLLAGVRTDLDFFSRTEASALELDGYRMTRAELTHRASSFARVATPSTDEEAATEPPEWIFQREAEGMFAAEAKDRELRSPREAAAADALECDLKAAGGRFFRPLVSRGAVYAWLIAIALVLAAGALVHETFLWGWLGAIWDLGGKLGVRIGLIALAAITVVTYVGSGSRSAFAQRWGGIVSGLIIPLLLAVPAFVWAWMQLFGKPLRRFSDRIPSTGGDSDHPS